MPEILFVFSFILLMQTILYIKHANSSFVLSDQRILEKEYHVKSFLLNQSKMRLRFIFRMILLVVFILRNSYRATYIVTWFADYHAAVLAFLGQFFRSRVIIFAGGQEACKYPELKKGVYRKKFRGWFSKYALRHADLIIPNHQSLISHTNYYYDPKGKKDGIKFYIPDLKTKMIIIPNGINPKRFYRDPNIKKISNRILTFGTMNSIYDFINKGFDLYIELAKRHPELHFVLIGIKPRFLSWVAENYCTQGIKNLLIVTSFCPDQVLFEHYNQAVVFIQASITEGMPYSLNEAMLCGCIPVGSHVNGIPDAIGETGVVIDQRNIESLEAGLLKALTMDTEEMAIRHVLKNFSGNLREKRLLTLFKEFQTTDFNPDQSDLLSKK